MSTTFRIVPEGPYDLARSRDFLCGFTPARGTCDVEDGSVRLAFLLDRTFEPVGVRLTARGDAIEGEVFGTGTLDAVRAQTARVLGLDHDATGFAAVGERDPGVARLLETYPGFRPVCFTSPYEAAVWSALATRTSMNRAASVRRKLATEHGDTVDVGGTQIPVVPTPERMLRVERAPYLSDEKLRRLHAIANAAREGSLDVDRLRSGDPARMLDELTSIRGVGPWSAGHILVRGAATRDVLPLGEPRVSHAVAHLRGGRVPSDAELTELADAWRPFRTWVAILVTMHLSRTGQWNVPGRRGARRAS